MSEDILKDLTVEEARILRHEAYIGQLLKYRIPNHKPEPLKPAWQRFLESSGGTALITVIIGGIFGAVISGMIQSSAKDREFQQSWLKARGDQALTAYKEHLTKQQEVVNRAYDLIGKSISAGEDLIAISGVEFSVASYEGEQRRRIEKHRADVIDKFNSSDAAWRSERDSIGLMIDYYHPRQDAVLNAWQGVENSVTGYLNCAEKWRSENPVVEDTSQACGNVRNDLTLNLKEFGKTLETSRTYAWEGWESPDKLKEQLNKH
jgi:hypothetical protein